MVFRGYEVGISQRYRVMEIDCHDGGVGVINILHYYYHKIYAIPP